MYKVVIADDEAIIRAGLRELIAWEELGMEIVYEAENGVRALSYLEQNEADVLITDIRMEEMNGLVLIEKAKQLYPRLHCVILTGYDDFVYTKKAIQLGIENYILKPIDENELMETLSGIENKLQQEEKGDSILDREKQVILQSVLARWLSGTIELPALRHRASFVGIPLDGNFFQACVLRVLESQSLSSRQNLGMALIRAWKPVEDVWMRVCWDMNKDLVLVFSGEILERDTLLRHQVEILVKNTGWADGTKLFAAFGTVQEDPGQLVDSYHDARLVAELSLVMPAGSVAEYTDSYFQDSEEQIEEIPQINFESLETEIQDGDKAAIAQIWDEWEMAVSDLMIDPKRIKSYAAESMCRLIILQMDTLKTAAHEADEQSNLEAIFSAHTVTQLAKQLQNFCCAFADRFAEANRYVNPSVRRCIETVEEHYAQELTLRGLSEQFHVNPVYLGRLFKEETGQTFTAYLNQIRIREAKRMLVETENSVASIAAAVGYLSQGYFTNLFKKTVGCFPREYRLKQR